MLISIDTLKLLVFIYLFVDVFVENNCLVLQVDLVGLKIL